MDEARRVPGRNEAIVQRVVDRTEEQGRAVQAKRDAAQAMLDAQGEAKARAFLAGPKCAVCRKAMATRANGDRHFLCDVTSTVGRICSCPPGCTDRWVGDRGTCDPECQPCRQRRSQPAKLKDK